MEEKIIGYCFGKDKDHPTFAMGIKKAPEELFGINESILFATVPEGIKMGKQEPFDVSDQKPIFSLIFRCPESIDAVIEALNEAKQKLIEKTENIKNDPCYGCMHYKICIKGINGTHCSKMFMEHEGDNKI